jgi:cytochrome c oxidase cbb3-type subunit 3
MSNVNAKTEQDRLLDHAYDGIQEYDNPMPRWWVWLFWATIIFSVIYFFDVTGRVKGIGREAEYEREVAEAARRWPHPAAGADAAALAALAQDPKAKEAGKAVYTQNCASCHRPDGGGLIGPNLADDHWIHGGTPEAIQRTIAEGVLAKGMPAWGKMLKPEQVDGVTAYVVSLRGTNPPDAKAPQGEKVGP